MASDAASGGGGGALSHPEFGSSVKWDSTFMSQIVEDRRIIIIIQYNAVLELDPAF